jgi:hypothetical protein
MSRQTADYPPYKDDRPPKGVTIRETYMTWSASLPPFLIPRLAVLASRILSGVSDELWLAAPRQKVVHLLNE